jgi:hypothetical protein
MSGISQLLLHSNPQTQPRPSLRAQSGTNFQALLNEDPAGSAFVPPDRAMQFGAHGVFAPRRAEHSGSELQDQNRHANFALPETAVVASEAVGVHGGIEPRDMASQRDYRSNVGMEHHDQLTAPITPRSGMSLGVMPAIFPMAPAKVIAGDGEALAQASVASAGVFEKMSKSVGGRLPPAVLAVTITNGTAEIVARADAAPAEVLARVSRLLRDEGIGLIKFRLNGQDVTMDNQRIQGGFDGASAR